MEAIGPLAITAVIIGGIFWALIQECRDARAAEPSRTAPPCAHGPAVLPVSPSPFPVLRPYTDEELAALAAIDYWDHIMAAIGEPDHRGGR